MSRDPSKTEKATPKRINKARGEGNVAKSKEVSTAVTMLAGTIGLYWWASYLGKDLSALFRYFFTSAILNFQPSQAEVIYLFRWLSGELAKMILPILLLIGFLVFLSLRLQVGKLWTTKVFEPKLNRFNPINGLKRMLFSVQTLIRMGKSLLQALFIGIAPWIVIKGELGHFLDLFYASPGGIASYLLSTGFQLVIYALVPMTILALVDWAYTRWDYAENLKMTKDEVKDEHKQMEGDPQIKSKQRQKMYQLMSRKRMIQDVARADVVITNPTHLAVALRYDTKEAPAPMVLAKGADFLAAKIREAAKEARVPIRENVPLARALYKQVEVGDVIPEDLYQAVAAILAQIWKAKGKKIN